MWSKTMKIAEYNVQTKETKTYDVPDEVQPIKYSWDALRAERDMRLRSTDIYALADRTLSDGMKTYRQALRDLPANTSDPTKPTWPKEPT